MQASPVRVVRGEGPRGNVTGALPHPPFPPPPSLTISANETLPLTSTPTFTLWHISYLPCAVGFLQFKRPHSFFTGGGFFSSTCLSLTVTFFFLLS